MVSTIGSAIDDGGGFHSAPPGYNYAAESATLHGLNMFQSVSLLLAFCCRRCSVPDKRTKCVVGLALLFSSAYLIAASHLGTGVGGPALLPVSANKKKEGREIPALSWL
jgi:hypothetical protein